MSALNAADGGPRWRNLYTLAGIAASVSVVTILLGLVTYFIWPYAPGHQTTEEILSNLRSHTLGALISLDLFLLVSNLLSILLFLALYVSLRQVNEAYALVALAMGLIAVILLVPARPILELYALSGSYAAAATEAAKGRYLAAGDALLTHLNGIGWFLNTLLGGISLLISSWLMRRSPVYSRATAYVGIITNIAVCGFFLPGVGTFLLFLTLPGYIAWYLLLAKRFFRMGQGG